MAKPARREPIEIVVADKNPLVLSGLRRLFAKDDRFRLAATASDGERFLEAVRRMKFNVGVIGWDMPYCDGLAVLEVLRNQPGAPRMENLLWELIPEASHLRNNVGSFTTKNDRKSKSHTLTLTQSLLAYYMVKAALGIHVI